ncbi:rodlin [Streptomyces sp. JJ36]|uniref:rodlin n=1 Tax=Streptomyces sp. JJ36 TaxID=2736645 RepID=UPI001F3666E3|nr:rodlin [Streptomyces sp. JJ36]MCF6524270.1 RdlA protein [Streptomyces sp. JJ36]
MLKKVLATAAVAASVVGATGAAATPAMATSDDRGGQSANGNGSKQAYGNTTTGGYMSPNMSLVNGSLNKPCIAVPFNKLNAQSIAALLNIGVQDILTSANHQTCTENSSLSDGDDPLSHLLEDFPIISQNGAGNANNVH